MADNEFDPDTRSSLYTNMEPDWVLIRDVLGGARAVRAKGELYLPKFPGEDTEEYNARVAVAPFTPHYEDSTRTLIGKPFSKEVALQGDVPDQVRLWSEDIDLAGTNLHNFAKKTFAECLHMGGCYIFTDYPTSAGEVTLAQEREAGKRPYFRMIPVDQMLAIYSGRRNGKTFVRQVRFTDDTIELADIKEIPVLRRRIIDDIDGVITQRVYEKREGEWEENAALGGIIVGIAEIPVVFVRFGNEIGKSAFDVKPTMLNLAEKQMESYRHANRLDQVFDYAGFPMLQAKGMGPPTRTVTDDRGQVTTEQLPIVVGPKAVLFAAAGQAGDRPEWDFISPDAGTIKEIREHNKDLQTEMNTLGLQPHMPSVGIQNMAATTSAINSARTHSAVQAWAYALKDGLEQAFVYMCRWAKLAETVQVFVYTDFAAEVLGDADEAGLREDLALGNISWDTYIDEMLRRGLLGPQFDKEEERERLATSGAGLGMGSDDATNDEPAPAPAADDPPVAE